MACSSYPPSRVAWNHLRARASRAELRELGDNSQQSVGSRGLEQTELGPRLLGFGQLVPFATGRWWAVVTPPLRTPANHVRITRNSSCPSPLHSPPSRRGIAGRGAQTRASHTELERLGGGGGGGGGGTVAEAPTVSARRLPRPIEPRYSTSGSTPCCAPARTDQASRTTTIRASEWHSRVRSKCIPSAELGHSETLS